MGSIISFIIMETEVLEMSSYLSVVTELVSGELGFELDCLTPKSAYLNHCMVSPTLLLSSFYIYIFA